MVNPGSSLKPPPPPPPVIISEQSLNIHRKLFQAEEHYIFITYADDTTHLKVILVSMYYGITFVVPYRCKIIFSSSFFIIWDRFPLELKSIPLKTSTYQVGRS